MKAWKKHTPTPTICLTDGRVRRLLELLAMMTPEQRRSELAKIERMIAGSVPPG